MGPSHRPPFVCFAVPWCGHAAMFLVVMKRRCNGAAISIPNDVNASRRPMRCTAALVAIMIAVSVPSIALTQTEKNNNRLLLRTEVDAHELFVERIHLPAGGGFARRNHPGHEIIYVLEGAVKLDIGSSSGTVEAGEVFHVDPGP